MAKRQTAKRRPTKKTKKRLGLAYPIIFFLLLCAGVYLLLMTFGAKADDLIVSARINGDPVTGPAVITSPADGAHFTAVPITVTGTCPANAAYVQIFRNNVMSGSAICQANSFSLDIDLFAGQNTLIAHVFNITDDEGPQSAPVNVFYDKPSVPPPATSTGSNGNGSGSSASGGSGASSPPFVITTPFVYKGYYVNDTVEWPLNISGGTAPYAFNIDWGDGTNSVISRKNGDAFNINHKYTKAGGSYKGSYTIKIQASDSDGNYAYLQFFVIVSLKNDNRVSGVGNIYSKPPPTLNNLTNWLKLAWPVYIAILIMVTCFKLGEKEELEIIKRKGLPRPLPRRHA